MATVKIAVTSTSAQTFPVGTVMGATRFSLLQGTTVVQTMDVPASATDDSATFSNVAIGDYTAVAQALDGNNALLGSAATANFTVAPTTVTLSVPSVIAVSLS